MRLALLLALALPVSAQTVTRVSVSSTGEEGNAPTTAVTISESGRWVAMQSSATNLVAGDTNGADDIFLHDRNWGTTTRISVATGGTEANAPSSVPSLSGSGQRIVFESLATNLVAGYGPTSQVYVHDRGTGITQAASAVAGNGASSQAQVLAFPAFSDTGVEVLSELQCARGMGSGEGLPFPSGGAARSLPSAG